MSCNTYASCQHQYSKDDQSQNFHAVNPKCTISGIIAACARLHLCTITPIEGRGGWERLSNNLSLTFCSDTKLNFEKQPIKNKSTKRLEIIYMVFQCTHKSLISKEDRNEILYSDA